MKRNGHGRAKILTIAELQLLFTEGLPSTYYRCLFAVTLFSACRINEAVTLLSEDAYDNQGKVRTHLTIRKSHTKGQLGTRTLPIIPDLQAFLAAHQPEAGDPYLFPGLFRGTHLHPDSAARVLRKACAQVGIEGASTHSFRRTALTQMSDQNVPIRVIAAYSGHRDLAQLNAYLEVRDEQVLGAAASLSMLSPVVQDVGKVPKGDKMSARSQTESELSFSPRLRRKSY